MQEPRRPILYLAALTIILCLVYLAKTAWQSDDTSFPAGLDNDASSVKASQLQDTRADEMSRREALDSMGNAEEQQEPATQTFTLRGRCFRADDKTPMADCTAQTRRELTAIAATAPWPAEEPSAEAVTGKDGVFDLQVPIDPRRETAALCLASEGYVSRMARWKRPAIGSVIDVGDILMDRAIQVTGIVTHPDGDPVADVGILFANVALTGQKLVEPARMLRTRTDAAGRFTLSEPAFLGEWYPRVEGSGALIEPQMVVLGNGDYPNYRIQLSVEKPDPKFTITGSCTDEAGLALTDVHVTAYGGGFTGQGWSQADGSVTIPRGGPSVRRGTVSMTAYDTLGLYEQVLATTKTKSQWGDRDVKFVLRRLAERSIQALDARGQAVTAFSLFAFRAKGGRITRYPRLSLHGEHQHGRVKLTGLRNGTNGVIIVPTKEGLGSTELLRFEADSASGPGEFIVTVPDLSTLIVQVTDSAGEVVSGSRVELLQTLQKEKPTTTSEAVDISHCDRKPTTPTVLRLADLTTDLAGQAQVQASPGSWFLRITGESHVPLVQSVLVTAVDSSVQVTVQSGCRLSGTVGPASALATLRRLSPAGKNPVTVQVRTSAFSSPTVVTVDPDGSYAIGGLTPGKYTLSLRYWTHSSSVTEGWIKSPVTELNLPPGHHETLPIDASRHLPGKVSGRILVDGVPLKGKHCFAKRRDPSPKFMLRFATDNDGRFEASLPPGTYTYAITIEAQPGPGWIMITDLERWKLAPGDSRESALDFRLRSIRVRLLDTEDSPLANQPVTISAKDFHRPGSLQTDATGWVKIEPAPLTAFHLRVEIDGEKQLLGPIDLPPGQATGELSVRLEAK